MSPVVDVHAHTLVPDAQLLVGRWARTVRAAAPQGGAGARARDAEQFTGRWWHLLVDLDERLSVMDAAGVDVQVVSVAPWQYHYWADRALAGELVVAINDEIAGLARRAPDRLVGVGTVALQHPDLAADQLRRAVDDYDFRGVQISTSAGGRDLSDPVFDPFWSVAESLGVVVFVHPWGSDLSARVATAALVEAVGEPIETTAAQITTAQITTAQITTAQITMALSQLVFGGVLDRFPHLAVCGAHGGGYVLQALEGADRVYDLRPDRRTTRHRPTAYLGRLYVDSVVDHDAGLRRLVDVAGPERVLLGSDYPFRDHPFGAAAVAALDALSPDERSAVSGGNATGLLRLNNLQDTA